MTDDTQTPRCEHTDDMFEAVESTRAAHMQAGILLALKVLGFESGDWPEGSAERHYREQIELVKGHLTKAIDGEVNCPLWRDLKVGEEMQPGDRFCSKEHEWVVLEEEDLEVHKNFSGLHYPTQRRVIG